MKKGTNAFDEKNKKNMQHLVKNIMLAVQNFLLSIKHLHIASQSYSEVPNKQTGINKRAG